MENREIEFRKSKAESKLSVNLWLLGVSFTLFTFVIAVNPDLLKNNIFLSLQLTLAIPFLMSSIFARTKLMHADNSHRVWDTYGFITFIMAYSFLINVVGIFLSTLIGIGTGMIFFGANILFALVYSIVEINNCRERVWFKAFKDFLFIIVVVLLGVLPSLYSVMN